MGLAMAVGPLVGIMAGVPAGHLVDRFGPIPVTLAGMALVPIASIGFATVPAIVGVAGFIIFAVTLTPGNQLFMVATITEEIARAGQEHQGAASGLLNLARNLGFVIGTPLLGLVYEAAAARAPDPVGATLGPHWTFGLSALAGFTALLIAWATYRVRPPETQRPTGA